MNVVLGSAFRNSTWYLRRYFAQVAALRELLLKNGHALRLVAVEGDSADETRETLSEYAKSQPLTLFDASHGGPWFGSVVSKARMTALSRIGNRIFESVRFDDDVLVYVESDLVWDAEPVYRLILAAADKQEHIDVHVPMVFAGSAFYDIWAYRKDGESFSPFYPYHRSLNGSPITEIDSAGSCLIMRGEVARACRIRDDNCLVGWCADAKAQGYRIGVHTSLRVNHP